MGGKFGCKQQKSPCQGAFANVGLGEHSDHTRRFAQMQAQVFAAVEIKPIPVNCPNCHKESTQKAFVCPSCKRIVVDERMDSELNFCTMCGASLK
jgi:hypothetical protein